MSGPDSVARSDALDEKLADNPVITNLVKISRQHGVILKILMFSIAFDLALSGAMIYLAFQSSDTANQAKHAAETAASAKTQAYNQCIASNDSRHTQLQLWEFILSIPPDPTLTDAERARQQQEAVAFKSYVEKKLAPRDCHSLKAVKTKSGAIHFTPAPTTRPQAEPQPQAQGQEQRQQPQSARTTVIIIRPTTKSSQPPSPTPSPTCTRVPVVGICNPITKKEGAASWRMNSSSMKAVGLGVVVLQASLLYGYVTSSLRARHRRTRRRLSTSAASATGASTATTSSASVDQQVQPTAGS